MNAVDDELGLAIEELCFELFASKTACDALPVVRAAACLAASSRAAQSRLGRVLVEIHPDHHPDRPVVRLCLLAERFLYDVTSSVATLALLAVLAHDNSVNQRRIARHLPGLCVSCSQDRPTKPLVLLVLSLPTALRTQYKQWRLRSRLLRGHRLPTGVPPARDGVPAPCFCNDCLGSSQLFATWIDHFNDLTRWSEDDDATGGLPSRAATPHLRSEAFVQRVLESDYRHCSCPWATGISTNVTGLEPQAMAASIHYFSLRPRLTPLNENPEAPRRLDPIHDVCAIEIDQSIAPVVTARKSRPPATQENDEQHEDETPDRILLFLEQAPLQYCQAPMEEKTREEPLCWIWSRGVARFVDELKVREEDASRADQLLELARTSDALEAFARTFCSSVFQYLEPHLLVSHTTLEQTLLSGTIIRPSPHTNDSSITLRDMSPEYATEQEECDIRISAMVSGKSLDILAQDMDGTTYAGSIQVAMFLAEEHPSSGSSPPCWALHDESLRDLLPYCRLCRTDHDHGNGNSAVHRWLCLAPVPGTTTAPQSPLQDPKDVDEDVHRSGHQKDHKPHTRGLSPTAERRLLGLKRTLATQPTMSVVDVTNHLKRIVRECNIRMSALAVEAGLTASLRGAARERCRVCRDMLVQAGKRMKLGVQDSDAAGTLSNVASSRLQREIDRVLQLSDASDAWEAPDERVAQLRLSRRAWASGVPDPEFYIASDARARANRVAQRQLNRRLVARAHGSQ